MGADRIGGARVRWLIYGGVFVGGVATGLYIAKLYARHQTEGAIGGALDWVGGVLGTNLRGGSIEQTADRLIVPSVSG